MAAGLPIVASNVGGIPEILTSPELGVLVEPLTAEAFANGILEVLARPDRGRAMGTRARASLAGRFDPVTGGARLRDVYLSVLHQKNRWQSGTLAASNELERHSAG